MHKLRLMHVIVTAAILLAVFATVALAADNTLQITLNQQNNSAENGTASFTDLGNGMVRVDVVVNGAPTDVEQPMHIHKGTCATLDPAPAYPLNNLVNGKSSTQISTTLEALTTSAYALNGHKSPTELSVYVFCGDILAAPAQGTVTATVMAETPTATTAATTAATLEATSTTAATAEATSTTAVTAEATTLATTEATAAATVEATTVATTEATTAATAEATTAATAEVTAVATTESAVAPTPEATPVTVPTTGADLNNNGLFVLMIAGAVLLMLGLLVRRVVR